MNTLVIRELVRVAAGSVGILSVYCGYKLFCEIPFARNRTGIHALSGALLALFGSAILIVDVHGLSNRLPPKSGTAVHHTRPAGAGSFTPHLDRQSPVANWTV